MIVLTFWVSIEGKKESSYRKKTKTEAVDREEQHSKEKAWKTSVMKEIIKIDCEQLILEISIYCI